MRRRSRTTLTLIATTVLSIVAVRTGSAQDTRPAGSAESAATPVETSRALPASRAVDGSIVAGDSTRSAPLLREGSNLVRVAGRLERDEHVGAWTFHIDASEPGAPAHELIVLPNMLLGEIEQMVDAAPGRSVIFEMTGQVYVYRLRNYFLPTHPPLLLRHEAEPSATREDASAADDASGVTDSTDDIIRNLERAAGPVPRRPASDGEGLELDGAGDEIRSRRYREGHVILERRGHIRRTPYGALQFVFDADAEGLADPPLTLLPCLLLERLERYARQTGDDAAVLLTGRVYTHRRRNYLLPSVYRIPRLRTLLAP